MTKKALIYIIPLLLLVHCAQVFGVSFPDKPEPSHFYVDQAGLVDQVAGANIDEVAGLLLRQERVPIYVVTIPSLMTYGARSKGIERYATMLFNHWGIGWKERNYGILLLVSKGDRKARIELGKSWAGRYDDQAQEIMDDLIISAFKRGDFATGITDGVRGLDAMARGLALPKATVPVWFWPAVLLGGLFLIMLIINFFKSGRSGWAWLLIAAIGAIILIAFKILSLLPGSSSGGFGGGTGGGGGATGSW